jgi:hypothetical protein
MRQTGAHLCLKFVTDFCCIIIMHAPHPPSCSCGNTSLKWAIFVNELDVVALLRSAGAKE